MANLLESYKNRLAISESVYAKSHNGEKLSNFKKIATARCLENINHFMTEAFANSVGTQRSTLFIGSPNIFSHLEKTSLIAILALSGFTI